MRHAPDIADLFNSAEDWENPSCERSKLAGTAYIGASIYDNLASDGQLPFVSDPNQISIDNHDRTGEPMDAAQDPSYIYGALSHASVPPSLSASGAAPLPAGFRTTNGLPRKLHNEHTISPLHTRFDAGVHSTSSFSADDSTPSATSPKMRFWGDYPDGENTPRRRHDSMKALSEEGSPKRSVGPGRRRKSENVEPGSARAIYLEKNRQAASKCRSKQKQQQEELVETAREVERKNKVLKSEVEFLKGDMRDLMEMVGKHAGCPDNRLQTYVQREADRLAAGYAGSAKSPGARLRSPSSSASPDSQQ